MSAWVSALALVLALLMDRCLGEPPVRLHPVVWMGNYLGWAGARLQRGLRPAAAVEVSASSTPLVVGEVAADYKVFWLGAIYWIGGVTLFTIAAVWLEQTVWLVGRWVVTAVAVDVLAVWPSATVAVVLLALLLKPMLAWAMLKSEVQAVEAALGESLEAGRERLSWLVSRDVTTLTDTQVRESAIESLAENLNDSVVAPIFWFVLLGLPGAVLYRFANTADAMWGYPGVYKGQNWAWAGKWAARVDDVLNWLPARFTGLVLALIGGVNLGALGREAAKTPSPNSGWPMAAMALALGVALRKPGVYVLNPQGRAVAAVDTLQAIVYASKALLALVLSWLVAMVMVVMMGRA
jgi:adenosylcobinamide-phosphate synthase